MVNVPRSSPLVRSCGFGMKPHRLSNSRASNYRSPVANVHQFLTSKHIIQSQAQWSCRVCGKRLPRFGHVLNASGTTWQVPVNSVLPESCVPSTTRVPPGTRIVGRSSPQNGSLASDVAAEHTHLKRGKLCSSVRAQAGRNAQSSAGGDLGDWALEPSTFVASTDDPEYDQPSEAGFIIYKETLDSLERQDAEAPSSRFLYPAYERNQIKESWNALMRWSKVFRTKNKDSSPMNAADKVVVFGGGSFGTAMGVTLARQKSSLDVVLLLRDPYLCRDINSINCNTKYLKDFALPTNVRATTSATEAIHGAQYAVHAVPVQHSRAFLLSIKDVLPSTVPIICVSKGLEVSSGLMMSEVIPSALGRKQPAVFISGPSFAREVMESRPTGVVAACKDRKLAQTIQALFASQSMRVNITTDVIGVEICGALKNVLAIAAGIVEGLELGNNALAALIAQGCSEIRWLADKMGAKPATLSGLSGLGDIMLTCYGSLSRNRTVGIRLGRGETLQQILNSSSQVAEGVSTAGVVVSLGRKYRVSLPVLTAVAQVLDNNLTPRQAVYEIMNLPQVEEM